MGDGRGSMYEVTGTGFGHRLEESLPRVVWLADFGLNGEEGHSICSA